MLELKEIISNFNNLKSELIPLTEISYFNWKLRHQSTEGLAEDIYRYSTYYLDLSKRLQTINEIRLANLACFAALKLDWLYKNLAEASSSTSLETLLQHFSELNQLDMEALTAFTNEIQHILMSVKKLQTQPPLTYVGELEAQQLLNKKLTATIQAVATAVLRLLGDSPCIFSIISFGSLARGVASAYSDIEYAILIEHEAPEVQAFF